MVYRDRAPWDVGKPQSALVELIEKYPPADPVLDIGCGSGDLAIFLAERGRQVIGVDIVEGAIRQAREKAGDLPKKVRRNLTFREADLFGPTSPSGPYAAVVDSGFYHLFDEGEVEPFLDRLSELLAPAGRPQPVRRQPVYRRARAGGSVVPAAGAGHRARLAR
jgi:SAM-dependent methyltransferase